MISTAAGAVGTVENRLKSRAVGKSVGRMLAISAVNVLSTYLSMALRLFSKVSMALIVTDYMSIMRFAVDPAVLLTELSACS